MKPDWDSLADKLKDAKKVQIADVDCTVHQSLCQQHGVQGYPTVKYFTAGVSQGEAYQGARDKKSLYSFVRKKAAQRKRRRSRLLRTL
eukprot:UN26751